MHDAKEIQIDVQTMITTVPVGKELSMILLDPKPGKAKIIPLVNNGKTVVKSG